MKNFISDNEARTVARISHFFRQFENGSANLGENSNKIQDYKFELDGYNEKINLLKETALKDNIELDRKDFIIRKRKINKESFFKRGCKSTLAS